MTKSRLTQEGIDSAHAALGEHLFETPLLPSPRLSQLCDATVLMKAENIQRTGSFKVRGSVNKLRKLVAGDSEVTEVAAASAGNHAQGLAYAASRFGISSRIFMPLDAPLAKRRATQELGADVVLEGKNYDESRTAALEYTDDRGITFVDGFDDWDIIEGQGTIGVELVGALGGSPPDLVLVPAGGGGLLAGVLFYLKELYGDATRVVGVQCARATALARSLELARSGTEEAELPVHVPTRPTIADGIRIGRPGDRPFAVIRDRVDEVVVVSEESIYESIVHLYEHSRLVVEGAGAASVAALLEGAVTVEPGSTVVLVLSGGNVDLGAMQKIITAFLHKSQRRVVLRIKVKDAPGQLARVVKVFERERLNVTEVMQPPILGKPQSPEYTVFDVELETEGEAHVPKVLQALSEERERMREEGQEPFEILER